MRQLGRLASLKELDVYDNQMTGDVPAQIHDLTNLKVLCARRQLRAYPRTAAPLT